MKKILMTATYGDFFAAFEADNIRILTQMGFEVYLCADWHTLEFNYKESKLAGLAYRKMDFDFARNPLNFKNVKNVFKLYKLMNKYNFYYVETNNPVVGVVTRIAAKMAKISNISYNCHGFQFCKNGPKKDWVLYCPIEWLLSFWTRTLVVINQEDYLFAKKHLHNEKIFKIPGVGLDVKKFSQITSVQKKDLRSKYKIKKDSFVVLSVGELSERKNVITAIKATEVAVRKDCDVILLIVGVGEFMERLQLYVHSKKLESNIHFLGKRNDIVELNGIADVCIFPSFREGLGMVVLESMSMGIPLISSRARGVMEYSDNGRTGLNFNATDYLNMGQAILRLKRDNQLYQKMSINAAKVAHKFSLVETHNIMKKIYRELLERL